MLSLEAAVVVVGVYVSSADAAVPMKNRSSHQSQQVSYVS